MSSHGRPVSLQAMLVIKRAQAARERMEAKTSVAAPRRQGFSIASFFGRRPKDADNDVQPEEIRKRVA